MIDTSDVGGVVLYSDADHKFIWLGAESKQKSGVVQTMQYLIIDKGKGILLDPGGVHLFPRVVASVSRYINLDDIVTIFFSHQDPDVSSGIALWLGVTQASIYISELWIRFLPHFGIVDPVRVKPIEKTGAFLTLPSGSRMRFIPSHFMHSPGNFSLYDERSRILFSGDIGGGVFDEGKEELYADDFQKHIPVIEGFHKRLIASNIVARRWVDIVQSLNPDMIVPQHGAIFRGASVKAFLSWLSTLQCGIDLLDTWYKE